MACLYHSRRRGHGTDSAPAKGSPGQVVVGSAEEIEASVLPLGQMVPVWNALAGTTAISKFKDRKPVAQRLWTAFERASRHHLAELSAEYFGTVPLPRTSWSLMIRAVAYKMQEQALGGLHTTTPSVVQKRVKPARCGRAIRVLIREWRGVAHQVTVGGQGVLFHGSPIVRCLPSPAVGLRPIPTARGCEQMQRAGAAYTAGE
jgi:hypothetical protein